MVNNMPGRGPLFSVKPGRGPSMIGGVVAVIMIVIVIGMIIMAITTSSQFQQMGPQNSMLQHHPMNQSFESHRAQVNSAMSGMNIFFVFFCVIMIVVLIVVAGSHFYNASQKDRMSYLDVTSGNQEPDPVAQAMGFESTDDDSPPEGSTKHGGGFCPYCGKTVQPDFEFCPSCGKDI